MSIMLLQMQPFSAGHMLALEKINSPFLRGEPPTYQHLLRAALICAHPGNAVPTFDGWWDKIKLRLWLRRARRLDWDAESVKLQNHVIAGLRQLINAGSANTEAKATI